MVWYVILGFLAAFGLLCLFWVLCGLLMPADRGWELAVYCANAEPMEVICRFCRFRELGLTRSTLTLVDSELPQWQQYAIQRRYTYIRFCTLEDWLSVHGEERRLNGTGDGDPAGHHRSGGVSKL